MRHFIAVLLCVVSLMAPSAVRAAESAKNESIRSYLIESGAVEVALRMANSVFGIYVDQIQSQNPELPAGFADELRYGMRKLLDEKALAPGGFADAMIPVYADMLTDEEAAELLAFTRSPLGKKLSENAVKMSIRGEEVGRKWGESLGPDIEAMVEKLGKQYGLGEEEEQGEEAGQAE